MTRRSTLDVEMDILEAVNENGALKITHIIYRANLGGKYMSARVSDLVEKGLLLKRAPGKGEGTTRTKAMYALTDRGVDAALCWRKVKEYLR